MNTAFLLLPPVLLACIGLGHLVGRQMRRRRKGQEPASQGSVIGAMLDILGFILAITYSMVEGRFGDRKELLLQEANAIGTAALPSDPEPAAGRPLSAIPQ